MLFLPLAHVLAREIQVALVLAAAPIGHCPDTRSLHDDLAAFKPTLLLAVPQVFEKLYAIAQQQAADGGHAKLFAAAAATAIKASEYKEKGRVPVMLRVKRALFDVLVFRKLRGALGGKVEWVISGGAPLGTRLGHFFRGAGIPVLEGWGLTETTAAASVNRPVAVKIGTVGPPLAGTTVRVGDDGELLVRGDHVFSRYWSNADATADDSRQRRLSAHRRSRRDRRRRIRQRDRTQEGNPGDGRRQERLTGPAGGSARARTRWCRNRWWSAIGGHTSPASSRSMPTR